MGEVGAEGERAHLVIAAVSFGGELGDECFGFGAVGAGGVPAAAFLAGDGVESFVDDRLVAVPFAGDVSLHDVVLRVLPDPDGPEPGRTIVRTARPRCRAVLQGARMRRSTARMLGRVGR